MRDNLKNDCLCYTVDAMLTLCTRCLAGLLFLAPLLDAQDRYPDPIPASGFSVRVEAVATIPDSSPNNPPRLHVLTQDPGGRLFVNDQRGVLYTFDEESGAVTEYLDLRDYPELDIRAGFEDGFNGLCLSSGFPERRDRWIRPALYDFQFGQHEPVPRLRSRRIDGFPYPPD
jgi:hypothetical protein